MDILKASPDKGANFFVFYSLFTLIVGIFFTLMLFIGQPVEDPNGNGEA